MNSRMRVFAAAATAFALSACSVEPPPADEDRQTLIDDQLKVMDQAKAMEQQVLDSQNKTDEAMEQQNQ